MGGGLPWTSGLWLKTSSTLGRTAPVSATACLDLTGPANQRGEVRLQLHALAYYLATFLRCIELPETKADWSLTSLQL
jgi:hypothetical protein